jgi:plastocyanin
VLYAAATNVAATTEPEKAASFAVAAAVNATQARAPRVVQVKWQTQQASFKVQRVCQGDQISFTWTGSHSVWLANKTGRSSVPLMHNNNKHRFPTAVWLLQGLPCLVRLCFDGSSVTHCYVTAAFVQPTELPMYSRDLDFVPRTAHWSRLQQFASSSSPNPNVEST